MSHELMNLFAVPVYRAPLNRPVTVEERAVMDAELQDTTAAVANQSSRNKAVLDLPALGRLRSDLQQHLDQYLQTVWDPANAVRLRITQSWLTVTRQAESHHTHSHPNSVVSGVFYLALAEDDGLTFYRGEEPWFEIIPRSRNYYNAHSLFVPAKAGDLLLFPSQIKHGVRPVTSDIRRVSLAFNTFFDGELGSEAFSNQVRLSAG